MRLLQRYLVALRQRYKFLFGRFASNRWCFVCYELHPRYEMRLKNEWRQLASTWKFKHRARHCTLFIRSGSRIAIRECVYFGSRRHSFGDRTSVDRRRSYFNKRHRTNRFRFYRESFPFVLHHESRYA